MPSETYPFRAALGRAALHNMTDIGEESPSELIQAKEAKEVMVAPPRTPRNSKVPSQR